MEVDLKNANRGLWLVKVPKYIAQKWESASSTIEVGKMRINKNAPKKAQVSMTLSSALFVDSDNQDLLPKNHRLDVTPVTRQTMTVLSQNIEPVKIDEEMPDPDKFTIEGKIVQRLECRPDDNEHYMKLKMESFKKAHQPTRVVQQLDKVVQNYKPVATHKHIKEFEERKKAEGKRARDDKNAVMDVLFKAFAKHQYYNIKDLVAITKQPVGYLKEILKEVCNHNMKNPHKNMWELKPEYRYYKKEETPSSQQ